MLVINAAWQIVVS